MSSIWQRRKGYRDTSLIRNSPLQTLNPACPPSERGGVGSGGVGDHRNVQRFRGGLVVKAHRLVFHSTRGLGVIKKKRRPAGWRSHSAPEAGGASVHTINKPWACLSGFICSGVVYVYRGRASEGLEGEGLVVLLQLTSLSGFYLPS